MAELIVYLEPSKDTALYQCLSSFLNKSKETYFPSTAIKYPPHTSVTGFFFINDRSLITPIINKYDDYFKTSNHILKDDPMAPKIGPAPLLISTPANVSSFYQQKKHLLLPVNISSSFYAILTECATDINNTILFDNNNNNQKNALIRPKRIDHISLAYWDEPTATEEDTKKWLAWANDTSHIEAFQQDIAKQLKKINDNTYNNTQKWDIVLYERIYKSDIIGKPHLFNELARWHIYQ